MEDNLMFAWAIILLVFAGGGACLSAMGVGESAMAEMGLALLIMASISALIACAFLRKKTGFDGGQQPG